MYKKINWWNLCTSPLFNGSFPNDVADYISRTSAISRAWIVLKRHLNLLIKRQLPLIRTEIGGAKKILWINSISPAIGDSLMDLASRSLLKHVPQLDLYTGKLSSELFKYDYIFKNVHSTLDNIIQSYDLIILDAYSSRSIKIKCKFFKKTPFVTLHGHYRGPMFNRSLFNYLRINELLGNPFSPDDIIKTSHSRITLRENDYIETKAIDFDSKVLSIAIGGEHSTRTYKNWSAVINGILSKNINVKVLLLGSTNAVLDCNNIYKNCASFKNRIIDCVDKLSIRQAAAAIEKSNVLLCADGGLMHIANAVNTPTISLFAKYKPEWRYTIEKYIPFYVDKDVNSIDAKKIVLKTLKFLGKEKDKQT